MSVRISRKFTKFFVGLIVIDTCKYNFRRPCVGM